MKKIFIKSFSKNLLENKITVSCVFEISYYSGTSFTEQQIQLTMGTTGRGSRGYQHSSSQGCGKMTNVEVHNGQIVKTWKG